MFCSSVPMQVPQTPGTEILHLKECEKEVGAAAFWRVLVTVWDKIIARLHLTAPGAAWIMA